MGRNIEKMVQMSDIKNEEAIERIYNYFKSTGIQKKLLEKGAKTDDEIHIADKIILFRE